MLKVEGLDRFDGSQLFYRVKNPAQFAGKNIVIVGSRGRAKVDAAVATALAVISDPSVGTRMRLYMVVLQVSEGRCGMHRLHSTVCAAARRMS